MNVEQQLREVKHRLDILETREIDLKGRRAINGARALAASDLLTLGQARELISSPETTRIIEQTVLTVGGGPFGIPVTLGSTNQQGASGLFADAQHIHASGLSTKGDLLAYSTATDRLPVGVTTGEPLVVDSAQSFGLAYASGWKGAKSKALTSGVATGLFDVALPTLAMCGGVVHYSAHATNGTDMQVQSGIVTFAAVNKGGVYTTDTDKIGVSDALSASTFTVGPFTQVTGTNKTTFTTTATSGLTGQVVIVIYYFLDSCDTQTVTFL